MSLMRLISSENAALIGQSMKKPKPIPAFKSEAEEEILANA
jgi:hypothetical protein